ncbi:MAG: hypothetical protein GMKNLPBB_02890 [Myxococcota bacterium]|nr:hypothetical protein [Myxococcota bacterium]
MTRPEPDKSRSRGVLQIEPTDLCNLKCSMCKPHAHGYNPHGVAKGYMDFDLFRSIIDGIARDGLYFDHLIFQWLGDPSLHPRLLDMLEYVLDHARGNFGYFRIDSNAIRLTPRHADRLLDIMERHPGCVVLIVFSIDAITPETYKRVKGVAAFDVVLKHVHYLIEQRAKRLDLGHTHLNFEFQMVVQSGNHHEARRFAEHWINALQQVRKPGQYDDIMLKRLSEGPGGPLQEMADRLYDDTLASQQIDEWDHGFVRVKVWKRKPWGTGEGDGRILSAVA